MREEPEEVEFDPEAMLEALLDAGVRFVLIGGIAAGLHGSQRHTQDVDIVPGPGRENAVRLAQVLRGLHSRMRGVDGDALGLDPTDPAMLEAGANWTLTTDRGDLVLMAQAEGLPTWQELSERAESLSLGDMHDLLVVSRDDLIALKRAAGRSQDIEDIVQITHGAQVGAKRSKATVHMTATLLEDVTMRDAVEAAEISTSPVAAGTSIWDSDRPAAGRVLNVLVELDGATRKHAETWASVLRSKLADSGLFDRRIEAQITTDE